MMSVVAWVENPTNRTRPSFLQASGSGQAPVLLEGPIQQWTVIDAVQRQQIDILQPKVIHRPLEDFDKFGRLGLRGHLGLDHHLERGNLGSKRPSCISEVP